VAAAGARAILLAAGVARSVRSAIVPHANNSAHRTHLLDGVVAYLAEHGVAKLSLRPLARALGYSTRVLTYNFANKEELIASALERLDERQRERLRALPGWQRGEGGIGAAIRASWRWQLDPDNLPFTRLTHEIQGLAAGGRLARYVLTSLTDRVEFVARAIEAYGVSEETAYQFATFINATYTGLQVDYLTTGDAERTWAAVDRLATLSDQWIVEYHR
jgi:AcrR family transcriptional regulator